jgi:RNA polymerase sigma-70 factor (ECF subfamily)
MAELLEHTLIKKCQNGNESAFAPLIAIYKNKLFSYLYRLCGNREEAEDLFQETLIKAWKGMKHLHDQNKFSSWLFSIAHNLAMDSLSKKKRNFAMSLTNHNNLLNPNNQFDNMIRNEEILEIQKIVEGFPPKQKEVFLLRIFGEKKFKEIAEIMNEPLNTVLSHMHYSIEKIKTIMVKRNGK